MSHPPIKSLCNAGTTSPRGTGIHSSGGADTEPRSGVKIRVFHLIKGLGRGGAEVLLAEGLKFADRTRFEFAYGFFVPWKDRVAKELTAAAAPVVCFRRSGALQVLSSVDRVARELKEWRADLLHCHLPLSGVVGRLAGQRARIPVVYTEHNTLERYHPATRWLNTSTYSLNAVTVAVSADVATSIRQRLGPETNVRVIPNGIDVDRFDLVRFDPEAIRVRLGVPAQAPLIGTVAVLRPQKRLDCWIATAALLQQEFPNAHFLIVGDGPLRRTLEALVQAKGIRNFVFAGLHDDVRPYLAAMDVFLMTSQFEGLPIALLEALAMRRPVVSTPVGGIVEVIRDKWNGVLVPSAQPADLFAAVRGVLVDPAKGSTLGLNGRELVEQRYSMGRMARDLESLYEEVISRS